MRSCTRRPIALALIGLILPLPVPRPARAEIAGEQVVSGTATFDQSGNVTTITASDGAIINYTQFDVWANEQLHFVQPSSEARVLNRVLGDATHIDGGLFANGIVYIVNPAGIFFGSTAVVNVGGLYAAAGNISNEDFLARSDRFTLSGTVANDGSIQSPEVALLGAAVRNHGNISAPDGTIALVAGEKVLLTQLGTHIAVQVDGAADESDGPAIEQTGSVDAGSGSVSYTTGDVYSLAINHTGITRGREIELNAASGTVQVAGTLDASDRSAGATGGSIAVTGERVALLGAQLDASGDAGGGSIHVGGDAHGQGALANAQRTYVDEGSTLRADAVTSGDGGDVVVWSDEGTAVHGAISARGGAAGGDGGFAEISSGGFMTADGSVDLGAASGANGTLLYDPTKISIVGGTGDDAFDPSLGQVLFADLPDTFTVYESELEAATANVVLQAKDSITTPDASAFAGPVTLLPDRSLTLNTSNETGDGTGGIFLSGVSFTTSGTGAITLATGTGIGTGVEADLEVGNLQTAGGAVSLTTEDGAIAVGNVTTVGANGATGGAGGAITIVAGDANQDRESDITAGLLGASGGDGSSGAGGKGGAITVRSVGVREDIAGTITDPILGGGDINVVQIGATGGAGNGGAGGAGGNVAIDTTDGFISTGAIDTSGGIGTTGGNAGTITIDTRDANRDNLNDVTTGALLATGGDGVALTGSTGGKGGAITISTHQSIVIAGATNSADNQTAGGGGDIDVQSAIDASGGAGTASAGGAGGSVSLNTENGSIAVIGVNTSGGSGGTSGGSAGGISLLAKDGDKVGHADVKAIGDLIARGGSGANGAAGNGGAVTIRSDGVLEDTGGTPTRLTAGGGDIDIDGNIDASGATGTTAGGRGGNVSIVTTDGRIDAAAITTSGGNASAGGGGSAGTIQLQTVDADRDNANDIVVGALTAAGGTGSAGAGGNGGAISVEAFRATKVTKVGDADTVLKEAIGGGDVTVGDVVANGGAGSTSGGNAGAVKVTVNGAGNTLSIGSIDAIGGAGANGAGGRGGSVTLLVEDSALVIDDPIRTRGGAVTNTTSGFLGGNGGTVSLTTGIEEDDAGDVLDVSIQALIDAREGASGSNATPDDRATVDGGTIAIKSADDIDQTGSSALLVTSGDVTLIAKDDIGQATLATGGLVVQGSDEARPTTVGTTHDEDNLSVTTGGTATVEVEGGSFLGRLSATTTNTDATTGITITQIGTGGTDQIVMQGTGSEMVVTQVDTTANDPDVSVALTDPDNGDTPHVNTNGTLRIASDAVHAGRVFDARSVGDIALGSVGGSLPAITTGVVEEPTASSTPNPVDAVILIADLDSDGVGAITAQSGTSIDLNGGALAMFGAAGIGTSSQPIAITDGGRISALVSPLKPGPDDHNDKTDPVFVPDPASSAGIFVQNSGSGDLAIVSSTTFSNIIQGLKVETGTGDIEITNHVGSISLGAQVSTKPTNPANGPGGDVRFDGAVLVKANSTVSAGGEVQFLGAIDADADATGSKLTVSAGNTVDFGGDIGVVRALDGLAVTSPGRILFTSSADQSVVTQTGGIALDAGGSDSAVPSDATIAKQNGSLTLSTTGALTIGDGDKLSAAGTLTLSGNSVRFTDLSALAIDVNSTTSPQIFAREPGSVLLASGQLVGDVGTDIVANTVAFDTAPTVVGGGNAPRIATASGTAQNAAGLPVSTLRDPVTLGQLVTSGGDVLDLAILIPDPGHETPLLEGGAIVPPLDPLVSSDHAAPGAPVSREEVAQFLACAPLGGESAPGDCAPSSAPPYGSALDTDRAVEVARAYRELLGDSAQASAGRESIARAAADPAAELGAGSPAGRAYLTDVARVLGQLRLLGLGEAGYREARADLLEAVAEAIGSPQVDAARLGAAVDARAMGMPI
jgi:filamentous hemagglutinin family protein